MTDNYLIQMQNAQKHFLTYDQEKIIQKFGLHADENYLYVILFRMLYRINRQTGGFEMYRGSWSDCNAFGAVMTILDILCDSRDDRHLTGRWVSTQHFGKHIHTGLLELEEDPLATVLDKAPGAFRKACMALGGHPIAGGDEAYAVEVMDGLEIGILLWHGDEEFSAQLRFYWDENAPMYLKYETMHYTLGYLRQLLRSSL